ERSVEPTEEKFTGFVFKIQANMDPKHRDRIAFMRICSGRYQKGMKMRHVRLGKDLRVADALTFFSSEREMLEEAWAGDIIGLHRSEEHTSELQSRENLVCRLLLEKKKQHTTLT